MKWLINLIKKVFGKIFSKEEETPVITIKPERQTVLINDNEISGFLFRPKNPNGIGIVYCHGGWAKIESGIESIDVPAYAERGFTVFVLKFEDEYGNTRSLERDIVEARDAGRFLQTITGVTKLAIMGVSRGGFAALEAYAYSDLGFFDGCVALSAPTDVSHFPICKEYFAGGSDPVELAKVGAYENKRLLLLYGKNDDVTPPAHGAWLAKWVKGSKFIVFDDEGHNLYRSALAQAVAAKFLLDQGKE